MEKNDTLLQDMVSTYEQLWNELERLVEEQIITEYEKLVIKAMCSKVANALAAKHDKVKKEVNSIMGGEVLDYEAKRIWNKAKEEGEKQGKIQGQMEANIVAVVNMLIKGVSEEDVKECYPDQFEAGKERYEAL